MAKKKIQKNKKSEVQDFISKIKELRKINEPILLGDSDNTNKYGYPESFEWRGEKFQILSIIGRWTNVQSENPDDMIPSNETSEESRNCYRVELDNGFQVDISKLIMESKWTLIGIEPEFWEKMRKLLKT
jgi:hypothetical protein